MPIRKNSLYPAMVLILGGALVLSRFIEPDALPDLCLFRLVTGLPCMFCGLTHAFHALALGHVREAIGYHPLALLAFGLVIFHFVLACVRWADGGNKLAQNKVTPIQMAWVTFAIFTLVWGGRLLMGTI